MTRSLRNGGLGFRDIQHFNDALLAKVSWRIITKPSCLLARVLLGKYCNSTPFLESNIPNSASHGWRSICLGRNLLKPHLGKLLGNGEDTSIWYDPWLSLSKPQSPFGPATEATQNLRVSHLLHSDSLKWNEDLIDELLPDIKSDILKLRPSMLGETDRWAWLPTSSAIYSVKSGYYEALAIESTESSCREPPSPLDDYDWKANIWRLKSSPKIKLLLWKAMQNALHVGENLKRRSVHCSHCGAEESIVHLFFSCSFAAQIWKNLPSKTLLNANHISNFKEGYEASKLLTCLPPIGLGEGLLSPWIFSAIWNARNQRVFNDRHLQPEEVILQAILKAKEWSQAQVPAGQIDKPLNSSACNPLANHIIRCHTDAAWKPDQNAGFGWILTDHRKTELGHGSGYAANVGSPLLAEAMAIFLAAQHARNLGFTHISLASDSSQLVTALNSELRPKELHGIIFDILDLSSLFDVFSFNFISRKLNHAADSLAKESLTSLVLGLAHV